jgi:alpha-ketoglutarate-dependent taurine dioxygenase
MSIVFEHLYDEDHVFVHRWRKGDLIMWDNHVLQHARAPVDASQPRELRRCMLAGDTAVTRG